jgi:glyoxylase-like metal-dependent hydrolase (beta-lactamase superfamily II)
MINHYKYKFVDDKKVGEFMNIHPKITGIDVSGLGGTWVFLIRGEITALLDTGPKCPFPMAINKFPDKNNPPILQVLPAALEKEGITIADIDIILNSHIHFDHTAGNAPIKEASKAKVYIHADEAKYFNNPGLLFEHEIKTIIEIIMGKEHLDEERRSYLEEETGPGAFVDVDGVLNDGDLIELGGDCIFRVVHLPGHTQGSVGFLWEKEGIMLSGDAIQGVCGHGGGLPILDDLSAFEDSLERVKNIPIKTLVHTHPFRGLTIPQTTILQRAEIDRYIDECSEFMKILKNAAESVAPDFTNKPFLELYDGVVGKLPEGIGFKKWGEMPKQFFSPATLMHCIKLYIN